MHTTQDEFHAWRGHVADGTTIDMRNGDRMTLRNTMKGWQLFDSGGRPYSVPTMSAHVIECVVTAYPSESI